MIILGSTSPRRKELLKLITSNFKTIAPLFDEEKIDKNTKNYALTESYNKALSLLSKINKEDCLITSDTIVILNDRIYGKPKNNEEAIQFLSELNDKTHQVITGYTIIYKNTIIKKEVITSVTFNKLSPDEIKNYILKVNVLDKAGAYSIQDDHDFLIKTIDGSYYNVMGFPIEEIKSDLKSLNLI